jgi:hypothetical protein
MALRGKQGVHGRRREVKVVVEQTSQGGATLPFTVTDDSELASIGSQQIMHAVAFRPQ